MESVGTSKLESSGQVLAAWWLDPSSGRGNWMRIPYSRVAGASH